MLYTEKFFPMGVGVEDESISIVDDHNYMTRPEFSPGFIKSVLGMGGPRLKFRRKVTVSMRERGRVMAWLASVRGKRHPFWATTHYKMRGCFPGDELLVNGDFSQGLTGWGLYYNDGNTTLSMDDGALRITLTGDASTYDYVTKDYVCPEGPFITRAMHLQSFSQRKHDVSDWAETAIANNLQYGPYVEGQTGWDGLCTAPAPPDPQDVGTTTTGYWFMNWGTNFAVGDYWLIPYASVQRCALIDGGLDAWDFEFQQAPICQVDNGGLWLSGLPVNTNALACAGDIVEIGSGCSNSGQLRIVTADLNSDGNGKGYLQFEPEIAREVAKYKINTQYSGTQYSPYSEKANWHDYRSVVFGQPMGKFVMSSDPQITNEFGQYAVVEFEMEQVY